jgi:hypothetical protein
MRNRRRTLAILSALIPITALMAGPPGPASAASGVVDTARLDPPTQTVLGVQLPITGTLSSAARVTVRYRRAGAVDWLTGLSLHRVRPDTVHRPADSGPDPVPQFAGSVFDLTPATSYELELHLTDPGTGADETQTVTGTTRAMPADPISPTVHHLTTSDNLQTYLDAAGPGTVIQLATGTYSGNFRLTAGRSGTPDNPVVVRGEPGAQAVIAGTQGLDGGDPVLEVGASYAHIEDLTVRDGLRAIRFLDQTDASGRRYPVTGAVVRRVHTEHTRYGVTTGANDHPIGITNAYICDNVFAGSITDPHAHYDDGSGNSPDWDGVQVGTGSVVCHNTFSGFGDAVVTASAGVRAVDVYGNDVRWTYDNGVEADHSEGNVRVFRNRFLNGFMPLSFQPVFGGPAYAFRNLIVNPFSEPLKFHNDGGTQDNANGVLVYQNTIVKAGVVLPLDASGRSTDFEIENNLFIGGDGASDVVAWHAPFDNPLFDYNGYYPDARFTFNTDSYPSFGQVQAGGKYEAHGTLVPRDVFATLRPWPDTNQTAGTGVDASLAAGAPARDRALVLPNINNVPDGRPDLGALEYGCPAPHYGDRTDGSDASDPGAADPCTGTAPAGTPVSWTALRNAQGDSAGTLRKSGGAANAQDAGAVSSQQLTGDGQQPNAVEFSWPQSGASGCVGLDATDPGTSCIEIPYRLVLQPYQGGLLATGYDGDTYVGNATFGPGDRLEIAILGGHVAFGKNGHGFGTTGSTVTGSLRVDTSLWDLDSTVGQATVSTIPSLP